MPDIEKTLLDMLIDNNRRLMALYEEKLTTILSRLNTESINIKDTVDRINQTSQKIDAASTRIDSTVNSIHQTNTTEHNNHGAATAANYNELITRYNDLVNRINQITTNCSTHASIKAGVDELIMLTKTITDQYEKDSKLNNQLEDIQNATQLGLNTKIDSIKEIVKNLNPIDNKDLLQTISKENKELVEKINHLEISLIKDSKNSKPEHTEVESKITKIEEKLTTLCSTQQDKTKLWEFLNTLPGKFIAIITAIGTLITILGSAIYMAMNQIKNNTVPPTLIPVPNPQTTHHQQSTQPQANTHVVK